MMTLALFGNLELLLDPANFNCDHFAKIWTEDIGLDDQGKLLGKWLLEMENGFIAIGPAAPRFLIEQTADIIDEIGVARLGEVHPFGKRRGIKHGWQRGGNWRGTGCCCGDLRLLLGLSVAAGGDSHDNTEQNGK